MVGPTGANLTNLVWCEPGTVVYVLASDHPSHQLYFWRLLAQVSGVIVEIIQGPRSYDVVGKYSVHDNYEIDVDTVLTKLAESRRVCLN